MFKAAKITFLLFIFLTLLSRCTDKGPGSPYSDILGRAPFNQLTDSISLEPGNDELYFRRAILLNSNNFPEPALEDFRQAWAIKKDEKYALGISTLLLESKADSALAFLQEATRVIPGSFLLQLSLARACTQTGKYDEALAACNRMLERFPQQVDVLKLKADLLGKKGDTAAAVSTLQQAYLLTPFDTELVFMLALQYAETKNSRVLALCDSLIRADSLGVQAEPYYYKGIYYANTGEKTKALSAFDLAVKTNYNFLQGYIEKGALYFDMKKYADALAVFNLALNISPEFPDSYYWIAKCQQALGQKEEARLNYLRAYGLDQGFSQAKDSADKLK